MVLLGGLNGSTSASGVFTLDTTNGALRSIGALKADVHDAAGSIADGRYVVFGGGSPTTVASVEAFSTGHAAQLGTLPSPRSDATAIRVGHTTYIVGGYTGTHSDPTVLATTDGVKFTAVARLRVAVRYPAVASAAGKLYVFGGQAISGLQAGRPVNDIQEVDPTTHSAAVVAQLPEPIQASAAVEIHRNIYQPGAIPRPNS